MLPTTSDTDLLAYLAGGLNPRRVLEVEEEMVAWPVLKERLATLQVEFQAVAPQSGWRIPPPAARFSQVFFPVKVTAADVFGDESIRPDDRFQARICGEQPGERFVVVLYRARSGWTVVFPEVAVDATRLDEFPQDDDCYVVDLVARGDIGRQRWAIALPESLPADLDWTALQGDVMEGRVPVVSLDIEVQAA